MRMLWALLILGWAVAAPAQPRPLYPDLPSAEQPVRRVRTTGYTLALSWAPERCHRRGADDSDPTCADPRTAAGFTLHGLWPDGDGPNRWPQYCHPVGLLTPREMAAGGGATPSPQLMQHEWAKHGSCMTDDPARYLREEARLFRAVRVPDMGALARRRELTAEQVARAFAAANPGMRPGAVRLNLNRRGWLEEVWLCLGLDKRARPCPASQGGVAGGEAVRIETGGRRVTAYRRG